MNEQELKVVLQGALDGKEIQCKWYPNGSYQKVNWDELSTLIAGLNAFHREYPIRVKPDVKVFKYKTRPYEVFYPTGDAALGLWSSATHKDTEQTFECAFSISTGYSRFKWLAPVTEHEVEYV